MQLKETWPVDPVKSELDKGSGESSEVRDWVEQEIERDPEFTERMKVRHNVNEVLED